MSKKISFPYEYDPAKRKTSRIYFRVKLITGLINGMLIPLVFLTLFFFSGATFWARDLVQGFEPAFIVLIALLLTVVTFPLKFYSSLLYERKYGLSAYTTKGWFVDFFKSLAIDLIESVIVLTLLYWVIELPHWWIYAGVLYFVVEVVMEQVYPVLVLPIFYKLTPFKDQKLKKQLLDRMQSIGVKSVKNILVAKESDKSTKANAMFTGFGGSKRMVLFDTLLDNFTPDEVETVIGHELGHYVQKDILRDLALTTVFVFVEFYLLFVVIGDGTNWGLQGLGDVAGLPLLMVLMDLFSLIWMPIMNTHSRWRETAADRFGLEYARKPVAQISTEKRLADMALVPEKTHPALEFWLFSHPSPEKRIRMVEEWMRTQKAKV